MVTREDYFRNNWSTCISWRYSSIWHLGSTRNSGYEPTKKLAKKIRKTLKLQQNMPLLLGHAAEFVDKHRCKGDDVEALRTLVDQYFAKHQNYDRYGY
ncbi:MAG: hypothetical protein LBP59_10920 [Planctomycetaceae bacterium]|jgi:hypothetical protein|nr:hypothetical protein [Planctomycetaceae bacterium]